MRKEAAHRRTTTRHLVWDWNGTLMDDLDLCLEIINDFLGKRGRPPVDRASYLDQFDFPVRRYYERLGLADTDLSFEEASHEFIHGYEARRTTCGLHAEVRTTLEAASSAGLRQSLLSAYKHDTLEGIVDHFGLRGHFDALSGHADIYAEGKAARAAALVAASGHAPDETLFIGDTFHDYEVARHVGAPCVLLSHGHHSAARLASAGVPVLPSMAALRAHLGLR